MTARRSAIRARLGRLDARDQRVFDRLLVASLFVFAELEVLTSNALERAALAERARDRRQRLCLLFRRTTRSRPSPA